MRKLGLALVWIGAFSFMLMNIGICSDETVAAKDEAFMQAAALGGMLEVELGELAQSKAVSPGVKAFGERMVTDHSTVNEKLRELAKQQGVMLPDALDIKREEKAAKLAKLDGDKFDKEYMSLMVEEHKKDIEAFQKEAENGADAQVREFAAQTLPTLKEHLRLAEKTEKMTREKEKK